MDISVMGLGTTPNGRWVKLRMDGLAWTAYRKLLKATDENHRVMTFAQIINEYGVDLRDYFPREDA